VAALNPNAPEPPPAAPDRLNRPGRRNRPMSGRAHCSIVDRVKIGNTFRAIRLELHLRQADVAGRAGVSQPTISTIERGLFAHVSLEKLERVANVLQADLGLALRWREANLARLLDRRHAALQNSVVERIGASGWEVLGEDSFNEYGDRGSVDLLAWKSAERALLIIEIKTEIVDLQEMLRMLDMKVRVVPGLVRRSRGWRPMSVAAAVVLPSNNTHRRAVANHAALLAAT
jgi:transcriptional regulator with XRE-family HTH domain